MLPVRSRYRGPARPIAEELGAFAGFAPERCKQEQIVEALAPLARQWQGDRPQPFFGMRDVAAHFGVSLWTASATYRRLELEGLIVRVRGARTIVPVRAGAACPVNVRGVVAMVNWLPGFIHTPDQRFFVLEMEKALWDRGFVSEIVFYHEEDKTDPVFASRILAHRPNYVVWLTPGPADESTMATISDAGVRLVPITDQSVRTRTPQYWASFFDAMPAALRCWRREGVSRLVIPNPSRWPCEIRPQLADVLRTAHVPYDFFPFDERETMDQYVDRLAAQPAGVLFESDIWHARVCAQAPHAFTRLLATRPVLQCWPIPIEPGVLGAVRTDALVMPWRAIIDRIVGDLVSGQLTLMREAVVFKAVWRHRVPAASLSRLHAYERI